MIQSREVVLRCPACGLNQFSNDACVRCHTPFLPDPVPVMPTNPGIPLFARRLKQARKMLHVTQYALAERMKVPHTCISRLESGRIESPLLSSLYRLADGLSIPVDYLAEENDFVAFVTLALPKMSAVNREAILRWCEKKATA